MPRFEVFVPAAPPEVPADATLRLEAGHWLAALKAGLERLGGGAGVRAPRYSSVLCDVQADGSIHVTDPRTSRAFRIRELGAEPSPAPAAAPAPGAIGRAARAPEPDAAPPDLVARAAAAPAALEAALAFLLDLAMERLGCEAGSVFRVRPGGRELAFAAARGPRSDELLSLGLTVPMGVGLVGFSAQENVCVAVSDAQKDPRFHAAVSKAIGYETRSLLCAPIARQGRVHGALEVLNKRGGRPFEPSDLSALAWLARRAAELIEARR